MVVQIKGVSQGSARFLSRTSIGSVSVSDSWYAKLDTTTTDVGNGVAIDSSGNVYVVGTRASTDVIVLKYNNTGSLVWQRKLSGVSSTESGNGIAVDNLGNVYIVGTINNGVTDDILIAKYNTSGTLLWQTTLAGSGTDTGNGIAVDGSGNVYIVGNTVVSNTDTITAKFDTNGNILWQRALAGIGADIGYGIAVDSSGNAYITVHTGSDTVIAKYHTSGTLEWQRRLNSAYGTFTGYEIAVDSSGTNLYITGQYAGSNAIIIKYSTTSYNIVWQSALASSVVNAIAVDSSGNAYITGQTSTDILIAKYHTSGTLEWQRKLDSTGTDVGRGIAVDSSGTNVYITGSIGLDILVARLPGNGSIVNPTYTGKLKLIHSESSLAPSTPSLTSSESTPLTSSTPTLNSFKCDLYSSDPALTSAIVASAVPVSSTSSLTSTTPIQVQTIGGSSEDRGYGIAVDSSGNYYTTGYSNSMFGTVIIKYDSLGRIAWQRVLSGVSGTSKIAVDSAGNVYIIGANNGINIVKYAANGSDILWQRRLGTGYESGNGIAVDNLGNVYIVGTIGVGTSLEEIIIVKYDTLGTFKWQQKFYAIGSYKSNGRGIAVDSLGNVYVTGWHNVNTYYDALIIKYSTDGELLWKRSFGGNSVHDLGNAIAVDSSGNAYITGSFGGSNTSMMIVKYDTNGNYKWQSTIWKSQSNVVGEGIAADSSGNVYVTGTTFTPGGPSRYDIIIVKCDTLGGILWQRQLVNGNRNSLCAGIAINSSGTSVYISGSQELVFDWSILIAKIPSNGGDAATYGVFVYYTYSGSLSTYGIFDAPLPSSLVSSVASLSPSTPSITSSTSTLSTYNSPIAVQTLASANNDYGQVIAVDSSGNYYITGATYNGSNYDAIIAKYNSSGVIEWQRTLASAGTDYGQGIAVDYSGNVYIVGTINNGSTSDILIAKYNTSGTLQWQRTLVGTGNDYGNAIAVDSSANVYISATTGNYPMVAKFDTNGNINNGWQRIINQGNMIGNGIAVDSSGNSYITGHSSSSDDIRIFKYNTSGTLLWQRTLFNPSFTDVGYAIAVDGSGNVYITGYTGTDIVVAKYDTNGNISPNGWQRTLAGSGTDTGNGIAVDSLGNVYIVGNTGNDILIAKYDTNGNINNGWQRILGDGGTGESATGIAVDSSGNVYITGSRNSDIIIAKIPNDGGTVGTYGSVPFAVSSLTGSTSTLSSSTTSFTDSAGTLVPDKGVWISTFGASGSSLESANGIALDSAKNIYTIGKTLHTSGTTDSLLVKYNNSGTMQWQRTLTGSNSNDSGNGIAIDSSDNIYTVGTTGSNANDIVISKYNTSGVIQWQAILGTNTAEAGTNHAQAGNGIAVDSSGNVYITGSNGTGMLTAKYNSSGTLQWQSTIPGPGSSGYGIAVDNSGNVCIAGKGYGSDDDVIILKYNSLGTVLWRVSLYVTATNSFEYGNAIAVDSSNNVYVTGICQSRILLIKLSSAGAVLNNVSFAFGTGYGIAVDGSGDVYITASSTIIKYNITLAAILWQRTLGNVGYAIKVDGDYVYIAGTTSAGAKSLIAKLPNDGSYTGTYGSFTYAATSLTGGGGNLNSTYYIPTPETPNLTSSLILSSTELNASSVNNYLR